MPDRGGYTAQTRRRMHAFIKTIRRRACVD
jgi:hypothetical protein